MTDKPDAGEAARRIVERLRARRDLIAKHGHSMTEMAVPQLLDEASKRIEELEGALGKTLTALEAIQAMERQPGEELGNSIIMQVRTHDLNASRALLEPEDCKGVQGGKLAITHLFVGKTCARCGMSPKEVKAARAALSPSGERK